MIKFYRNFSLLILIGIFVFGCGSSKNQNSGENVQNFIDQRQFEIENIWATPLGGNRINLIGNPNFVKFEKDSVDLFLPYFGVRQMGGGYGSENGIKYKGALKELDINKPKDNQFRIKFKGDHQNESFNFTIFVYSNGKTNISVNSSQRNPISYQGEIKALEQED